MIRFLVLIAVATSLPAAQPVSQQIDVAVTRFEDAVVKAFQPIESQLISWRDKQARSARNELDSLLSKAAPEDKIYLAYHLLSAVPTHRNARAVFTNLGLPTPFDDKGVPTPGWSTPTCHNRALVEKVSALAYPPFDAVAQVLYQKGSATASFFKRQTTEMTKLKEDLLAIARAGAATNAADSVYPILAYYHPETPEVAMYFKAKGKSIPRQKVWFGPIDNWLITTELAGTDCLVGPDGKPATGGLTGRTWNFPENLRGARVEMIGTVSGQAALRLLDGRGRGGELRISGNRLELVSVESSPVILGTFSIETDLATIPMPVQFEARGRHLIARVGGVSVGTADLPTDIAYRRFEIRGTVTPTQLRVRYLGDLPQDALIDLPPVPAAPAQTAPAWMGERTATLDKTLSFAFSETSLVDVADMLGRLTGSPFSVAPSADPLKDLPVTMSADDLKLATALDWLNKLTDVRAIPTEAGFDLVWTGK